MITTLLDHAFVRTVVIPTLAAGYAATIPPKEPPPFPQAGDRFFLSVRGPVVGGRAGFARVYASPAGKGRWTTTVTCGSVDARGRETVQLQAPGEAWRDRDGLGGTWTPLGGGQMRVWTVTRQDGLDVTVAMAGPCPSGAGDVSSGD